MITMRKKQEKEEAVLLTYEQQMQLVIHNLEQRVLALEAEVEALRGKDRIERAITPAMGYGMFDR